LVNRDLLDLFGIAFSCAGIILYDISFRGYRQHMRIMEAV
jgi:hypothetical protein